MARVDVRPVKGEHVVHFLHQHRSCRLDTEYLQDFAWIVRERPLRPQRRTQRVHFVQARPLRVDVPVVPFVPHKCPRNTLVAAKPCFDDGVHLLIQPLLLFVVVLFHSWFPQVQHVPLRLRIEKRKHAAVGVRVSEPIHARIDVRQRFVWVVPCSGPEFEFQAPRRVPVVVLNAVARRVPHHGRRVEGRRSVERLRRWIVDQRRGEHKLSQRRVHQMSMCQTFAPLYWILRSLRHPHRQRHARRLGLSYGVQQLQQSWHSQRNVFTRNTRVVELCVSKMRGTKQTPCQFKTNGRHAHRHCRRVVARLRRSHGFEQTHDRRRRSTENGRQKESVTPSRNTCRV